MRMQEVESIKEPGLSEGETLGCRVLLTRLEEKRAVGGKDGGRRGGRKKVQNKPSKSVLKTFTVSQNAPEPKKSNQSNALCSTLPPLELRKRRLASLNAEAVNSLLLHRQDSSGPTLTKKRIERQDSRNNPKTKKPHSGSLQKHKRAKMEEVGFDLASLTTPTPRRQAGLMATALLRLSSTPRGGRCRSVKRRCEKQVHSKLEKQQVRHQPLPRMMLVQRCCGLCDRECSQEGAQRTGPPGAGGPPAWATVLFPQACEEGTGRDGRDPHILLPLLPGKVQGALPLPRPTDGPQELPGTRGTLSNQGLPPSSSLPPCLSLPCLNHWSPPSSTLPSSSLLFWLLHPPHPP